MVRFFCIMPQTYKKSFTNVEPKVLKVHKVCKVHKVYKVLRPLRGALSTAALAAVKYSPKDTRHFINFMNFINLINFTALPRWLISNNTVSSGAIVHPIHIPAVLLSEFPNRQYLRH